MHKRRSAFTLIEMLVVIGVIAIMAAGISMVNFGGGSQSIYTAQQIMVGAFFEAKTVSLTRHTETRVVIYKGKDDARRLRQVGVIYLATGDDDVSMGWASLNEGTILPEGTFFVPPSADFKDFVVLGPDVKEDEVYKSTFNNGYTGSYTVVGMQDFPSIKPSNLSEGNGDFYSYHFSSDGMSMNPGARVIIGQGRLDAKGKYKMDSAYGELGFVIHRIGNTIPFTSYEEIKAAFTGKAPSDDEDKDEDKKKDEDKDKKDSKKDNQAKSGNADNTTEGGAAAAQPAASN